ncbi:unnamed protein product [Strongylus vulgaris]|uniref:Uncharacterized protein n=1 Tax=Strongylus vulgaris TaxID=40348 RepID=A0A3P7IIX4_STRVU|nr:unnamed protein product [Strongylus vulgaris]
MALHYYVIALESMMANVRHLSTGILKLREKVIRKENPSTNSQWVTSKRKLGYQKKESRGSGDSDQDFGMKLKSSCSALLHRTTFAWQLNLHEENTSGEHEHILTTEGGA